MKNLREILMNFKMKNFYIVLSKFKRNFPLIESVLKSFWFNDFTDLF